MTATHDTLLPRRARATGRPALDRTVVGGFSLVMGGVHLGLDGPLPAREPS